MTEKFSQCGWNGKYLTWAVYALKLQTFELIKLSECRTSLAGLPAARKGTGAVRTILG